MPGFRRMLKMVARAGFVWTEKKSTAGRPSAIALVAGMLASLMHLASSTMPRVRALKRWRV